ncbi:unnamed protein product [Orchesella dallaii]|uniref:Uncharacterized protein n=1 Tax=Orchesella dallaii TaxID=48710 RepID=A0ABP1PNH4_9HEXA
MKLSKILWLIKLQPTPERGSFIDFIEETGTNAFLIEAVKKLYEVPNKPENPIEWLRLHFKYLAPDRTKEMQETEELLKMELSEIEAKLINALEEEAQNQEILTKLEQEHKNITMESGKIYHYEDFRKYLHHPDDYHHRIKPDPLYQASKSDMLLPDEDHDSNLIIELVPFNPTKFSVENSNKRASSQQVYTDYPSIYFPEKTLHPTSTGDDEETEEEEEEERFANEDQQEEKKAGDDEEGDLPASDPFIGERSLTGAESFMGEGASQPSQTPQQQHQEPATTVTNSKKRRSTIESNNTKKTTKSQGKTKAPKIPKNFTKSKTRVPTRQPSKSNQAARVSEDTTEFIERDPLLEELEPVDSSFWRNDFSVTGGLGYENLCEPSEHFDYEPMRLTENTLKIVAGSFRRYDETENYTISNTKNNNNLVIRKRSWIMDPNLVGPSFAEKLVYNGVPYDEEVAAEDAVEYYDNEDDEEDGDNWDTSVLSRSDNVGESNDDCCESPSNCECECEESSCSTSYCRTSTSISSYKEDDNTVGRRTAPTPLESSGTDNENKLMEIEGEYEEEMLNETVVVTPVSTRFSEPAAQNK